MTEETAKKYLDAAEDLRQTAIHCASDAAEVEMFNLGAAALEQLVNDKKEIES